MPSADGMPHAVLWSRSNAIGAWVFWNSAIVAFAEVLPDATETALAVGMGIAGTTLFLLLPILSPRWQLTYVWSFMVHIVCAMSCFSVLPALPVLAGFSVQSTRDWFWGRPSGQAPNPVARYGITGLIVIFWLLMCVMLVLALHSFEQNEPHNRLWGDDGSAQLVVDDAIDTVPAPQVTERTGATLGGARWRLSDHGGPGVVFIWATWCPDCDRAMAELAESGSLDVPVFALATDCETSEGDNRDAVRQKAAAAGVDWLLLCGDAEDIYEYPTVIVYDEERRARYRAAGVVKAMAVREVLRRLEEGPVPPTLPED